VNKSRENIEHVIWCNVDSGRKKRDWTEIRTFFGRRERPKTMNAWISASAINVTIFFPRKLLFT